MDMDTMAMAGSSSAAMRARAAAAVPGDKDSEKPIFTLKQMIMIADRMCEERVEQVRAEYDNILQQKLSEQVTRDHNAVAVQCTEIDNNLIKEGRLFVESFELHKCKLASRFRNSSYLSFLSLDISI